MGTTVRMGGVVTEPISMDQIRRARAFVNAAYYPDGNLPSPRVPEACTSEGQFGPCTQRCEQPAGHEGRHKASCFTWDDTSWTQTDDTGETVAAVSYAERIDLAAQPYTGLITDNQYVELFLRGEFYVVSSECTCPAYRFDDRGDVEGLPQGTNPDCRHCHPEEKL